MAQRATKAHRTERRSRIRRAAAFVASVAVVASGLTFIPGIEPVAPAQAEFAEGGQGTHRNSIDWFDFQVEGQVVADGQEYTNVRTIGHDEIRSTCKVSQVNPAGGAATYRPGSYLGDGLPHLYYRTGPGAANTLVNAITNRTYGGIVQFDFECSAVFVAGGTGTPVEVPLQGLVVADAESSSRDTNEYVWVNPQPKAGETASWYAMDRWRPEGCTSSVQMTPDAGGGMMFAPTGPECPNIITHSGPMAVGFMKGATKATVQLKGGGHSAVALGMVMSTDFGDAPSEFLTEQGTTIPLFGEAGAIYQPAWEGTEITTQARDVFDPSFELARATTPSLHLGQKIDAEVVHQSSWDALLDDETGESDEDGISPAALPQITEGQPLNDTNSLDVECSADPASAGWVAGWLDWNRDGSFTEDERSTPVQCSGLNQTVTMEWPGLGVLEPTSSAFAPVVYLRVRIAETVEGLQPEGVLVPTGVGSAGEVEDYALGVPLIEAYKESTPVSETPLAAGESVTYKVTFRNVGEVEGPIVYRDFLEDVLDNATFTAGSAQATASAGSPITLTEPGANPWLAIDGVMQPGETVEITYSVTVNDPVAQGGRLANYLLHIAEDGTLLEPRPENCEPENPRCTTHPLIYPELDVQKTAIPGSGQAVQPGETITYHLDFQNSGSAPSDVDYLEDLSKVLPYADISETILTIGEHLDTTREGDAVRISGTLPANGFTRVIVVVKLHDPLPADVTSLDNFLHEAGEEPPPSCILESKLCTTHPVEKPDLKLSKSADPATGTLVSAGQELTYTLTFDNSSGAAPAAVDHTDDLTDVLDDATFGSVTSVSDGLATAGPTAGKLAVTGSVAAGAVATVSYTVTVKADADRGNDSLANFLFTGDETPETCEPGEPCTTHPVGDPQLKLTKTATPASGEPVVAGQTVTYELGFDNTTGTAPATIAHTDDLSDVLDDATLVAGSVVASDGLTATGPTAGILAIAGAVPAGERATVTYSVTVNDPVGDGATLANFLFAGDEKPETCEPNEPCTTHPATKPQLEVEKGSDPASGTSVAEGDQVEYTLTFTNSGSAPATVAHTDDLTGVLDDAELTEQPTVAPAGALTGTITDGKLAIAGTLAPGATATVSYLVTVLPQDERGDHALANYLVPTGTDPPGTCDPTTKLCTTHPVPLPDLSVAKRVDVGSGTPVVAGQELNYGLDFDNSGGQAAATVAYVDDLSGVVDDATFDPASIQAPAGLTAVWSAADKTLTITGTVPAGQLLTVTYAVTVKADGERGDNQLANFLFEDGATPPTVCGPTELCTTNPVPELVLHKSADPASGDPVQDGETLTYTLTFDNSAGKAAAAVDHTDDLTDVLDDATFVAGSLNAETGLTAVGPAATTLTITGEVPAGETRTVTYQVTVNDAADRGNNSLANFLFTGDEKPEVCEPGDPCTVHPVAQINYQKLISAPTPVVEGSVLKYVIRITNTGEAAGDVSRVDDLTDVLDDAELTGAPESDTASVLVTGPTGQKITISGSLAAGATALVTYEVTVKSVADQGNHQAVNFLLEPGTEPPTVCDPDTEQCTITEWANLQVRKTADPESGTVLHAGDTVTYTLHFANEGTADATVEYTDHRAQVLSNATLSGPATASGSLALDEATPERLLVTGTLAPGAAETVTYTVTVDGTSGLSRLTNFLVPSDDTPPGICKPATELCTDHPIVEPGVDVQKTAKPGSGQTVTDGQVVTYALRFWNWSPTTAPIAYEDLLADVLDDADLVTNPAVTSGDPLGVALTLNEAAGPRTPSLTVTHPGLAPDQEFVVTYQVRVNLDKGGDKRLGNFVVEMGEDPDPGVCDPGDWHCTTHPAGKLKIAKQVDPGSGTAVTPGEQLSYALTFTNSGTAAVRVHHTDALGGVLDDAEWDDALESDPADAGVEASFDALSQKISITGELAPGDTVTVRYTVTVNPDGERGDNELANFLLEGNPPVPPVCDPDAGDICTTNPVPDLSVTKTADPESGTPVATGDDLNYTLTFDNTAGKAAATVAHTDDLSDVLDDASFVAGSLLPEAGLTATGPDADGKILIAGSVPAGEKLTVTYTVIVKPEAERLTDGNNSLANFLFTGDEKPEVCEPGDPCTVHPAPNLQLRKEVDPESTTTVAAGDTLTYTLYFDNSEGTAPAPVDNTDDLSGVLDDARFLPETLTADSGLSVLGPTADKLAISGAVPAGETLRVSYQVRVLPDGERGDNQLANFLLAPGVVDPPVTCEIDDPTCTTNPIPEVSYVKEVSASDDPIIAGKTELSYTVTVTNTGTATGSVARTDNLSDVLDDATVVTQPASDAASVTVTPIADDAFTIGGTIAAGATAKITYTVRVNEAAKQGNHQAANFLLAPGVTEPPVTCEPDDDECTQTPLPAIAPAKSAVTESGESWVRAGEAITYTLTFTNDGEAIGPVAYWDDLREVLTNAAFEGGVTVAQGAGSSVTAVLNADEERIEIGGALAAGESATVTYTMRMNADLAHGARVTNYLVAEGITGGGPACFPGDNMICTDHPAVMPGLEVTKSADPVSGTELREGDEVTYTLLFDAWGPDRSTVKHRDLLSDVVDDAELVGAPIVKTDGDGVLKAVVARGANGEARIDILGSLQAGTHATVTYTVRVLPDRERPTTPAAEGTTPNQLANFVIGSGEEPPTVCEPDASDCTVHPIETKPDIEVTKSVDPESGSVVEAGDQLSYTLTFRNWGTASGDLDFEDSLADVLDDAKLIGGPVVDGDGAGGEVTATLDGDVLRIAGALAPKHTATVTYTVQVLPVAAERPSVLVNFVVKPGEPVPEVCDPAQDPCTANPVRPSDPTVPVPKPPLAETGGASTLPWILGGAGLLLAAGALLLIARRRKARADAAGCGAVGSGAVGSGAAGSGGSGAAAGATAEGPAQE